MTWRRTFGDLKSERVKKVNVQGQEALLVEDQAAGERKVIWLDERGGTPVLYKVSTVTPELVSSEALLKAADSLR